MQETSGKQGVVLCPVSCWKHRVRELGKISLSLRPLLDSSEIGFLFQENWTIPVDRGNQEKRHGGSAKIWILWKRRHDRRLKTDAGSLSVIKYSLSFRGDPKDICPSRTRLTDAAFPFLTDFYCFSFLVSAAKWRRLSWGAVITIIVVIIKIIVTTILRIIVLVVVVNNGNNKGYEKNETWRAREL